MKKTLYILLATLCCSILSFAQDNKESIVLKGEGKALAEIVLSIRAEGEVSIQGVNSAKVDERGRYVCVLPDSDDPEITLTISASRILGLTLDQIAATSLDLRKAPSLTHLDCGRYGGGIQGLDLSSIDNLVYLNCAGQEIALLDLEKNEKLETLLCCNIPSEETPFCEGYGLLMQDGPLAGLQARCVIVIDEEGKIIYEELVPEITQEPDYDKAIAALKQFS